MFLLFRGSLLSTLVVALLFWDVKVLSAHGFGDRYDLPVPLNWYLFGAASVVALSFLFVSVFFRIVGNHDRLFNLSIGDSPKFRFTVFKLFVPLVKIISAVLLLFMLIGGFVGSIEPDRNIGPTLVWIVVWVGLIYFNALLFNVWAFLNPWKNIYMLFLNIFSRSKSEAAYSGRVSYPQRFGQLPALMFLLFFSWFEIVSPNSGSPVYISVITIMYSAMTFVGMYLFGPFTWLANGEFFSVTFRLVSRCSPIVVSVSSQRICSNCIECIGEEETCYGCEYCFDRALISEKRFRLRRFASGLYSSKSISNSETLFVLMLLSLVTFDGFSETPAWANIVSLMISFFGGMVEDPVQLIFTFGLFCSFFIFITVYFLSCWFMARVILKRYPVSEMSRILVYSLIPIAVGYHIAHYFSFLMIQGQAMIYLISDPMGLGWDLFQSSSYQLYLGVVNAKLAWIVGIFAIVVGHVTAVYASHYSALLKFTQYTDVIRSQRVMLIVMVLYTIVGLWILAQPIVEIS